MMKQTITKVIFLIFFIFNFVFAQGVELISNNDFESGLDGWELYNLEAGHSVYDIDNSGVINGISTRVNVFTPYKGYPSGRIAFFTKVEIDSGETYNISFKIRSNKVIDGNGIWWCMYDSVETGASYSGMWGKVTLDKDTIITYESSFIADFTNHGADFSLDLAAIGVDSVTLWIDDISLVKVLPPNPNQPIGSGTETDPYQIATLGNLSWFAQGDSAAWVAHYIQTADIDASATQYWDDSDDDGDGNKYNDTNDLTAEGTNDGFSPIGGQLGSSWVRFANSYDGQGHVIDGLYINRPTTTQVAFLGYAGDAINKATKISNLGLTNVNITGKDNVGALVGKFRQGDEITNCYSTGVVNGVNLVGGLVGECRENSSITKSYSSAVLVSTGKKTGGLVGYFYGGSGIISECYASGSVEGDQIGGFVGRTYMAHIQNCYSSAFIIPASGSSAYGAFGNEISEASIIENCYTIGDAGAEDGHGFARVSYNTVSTFTNNFFDTETTHQTIAGSTTGGADGSATGKITAEMKTEATFTGWDFTTIWKIDGSYPDLINNPNPELAPLPDPNMPSGSGTESDPYLLSSIEHLKWIGENVSAWGAYYVQTNDINAAVTKDWNGGKGFFPIGDNHKTDNEWYDFKGVYDGVGFVIDSLYINRKDQDIVGLFGSTQKSGGTIKNLGLTNVNIRGKDKVGGLVGKSRNTFLIENCYVTGYVTGNSLVGGLVGELYNGAHIENCHTKDGVVNGGGQSIGGFVGKVRWHATISQCYSLMNVDCYAAEYIGGFSGWVKDEVTAIEKCYSMGNVVTTSGRFAGGFTGVNQSKSKITNCYSLSNVTAGSIAYGFCGYSDSDTIRYSYSAANTSSEGFAKIISNTIAEGNFFDEETSGSTSGAGAVGKTTAEMKTLATYTDANWDFINIWEMDGTNYPTLQGLYTPEIPDELPLPEGGIELISNSYFNDGMNNWNFSTQGNAVATASLDSTRALDGKNSGKVAITKQGDDKYNWEIEMSQLLPGGIKAGKMYHIQYQAKASKEATLETWVQQWHNPFDPIYTGEMVLTTETQTFVDTFYVSESDSLVVWAFAYGAMGDTIDVWVDAVHVIEFSVTDVNNTENMEIKGFVLEQNYPNPFNPTTVISFVLLDASDVQLSVYNILGEKVTELVNRKMVAGNHSVNFNATNLASGMYIYRIQAGNFVSIKKMMLLK